MRQLKLNKEETALVLKHREDDAAAAARAAKQAACPHTVRNYMGHSHNDDAYRCAECGDIEWR